VGRVKRLLYRDIYSKRELGNSSKPDRIRAKGSLPEKKPLLRKSNSLYLRVTWQKEVDEDGEGDDE
jgi:hypothetical protein